MTKQLYKSITNYKLLNKDATLCAKMLFQAYPAWVIYASVEDARSGFTEPTLVVDVASPLKQESRNLKIHFDDRATVYYGGFHTHFCGWHDVETKVGLADCLQFIQEILNEHLIFELDQCDGITKSWRVILAPDQQQHAQYQTPVSFSGWAMRSSSEANSTRTLEYQSWRGTYDKTISMPSSLDLETQQ